MLALFSYLQFLLKSTNQHGVHSPFVYDFVTKCLYNNQLIPKKELKHSYSTLSNLQVRLLLKTSATLVPTIYLQTILL